MPSRTFVLHVDPVGHSTIEDVRTGRRVVLDCLSAAADQITRWLEEPPNGGRSDGIAGEDAPVEL